MKNVLAFSTYVKNNNITIPSTLCTAGVSEKTKHSSLVTVSLSMRKLITNFAGLEPDYSFTEDDISSHHKSLKEVANLINYPAPTVADQTALRLNFQNTRFTMGKHLTYITEARSNPLYAHAVAAGYPLIDSPLSGRVARVLLRDITAEVTKMYDHCRIVHASVNKATITLEVAIIKM